jgi:SAM-dependent methyltransferase
MTSAACWICASTAGRPVVCQACLEYGTQYDLVECTACGALFFDPLPTSDELNDFYAASYFDFDPHRGKGRGMAFARKYCRGRARGRFLDVGCATGFFLKGVQAQSGWETFGVEAAPPAARFARTTLGLDIRLASELPDAQLPAGFFDFVHVNNVLEHVRQPMAFVRECRRIIAPGGTMYLSVPNGFVDSRDLVTYCQLEGPPARSKSGHLFFFPARTLRRLIEDAGFEIREARTYGIRRGLRILGYLPRARKWMKPYAPKRARAVMDPAADVAVPASRKYPRAYHIYRFMQSELKMLPGLMAFGLDFKLLLTPRR